MIADTPKPPYYAVIFTSEVNDALDGYEDMGQRMVELAEEQEGYLGIESARQEIGITVSYWKDLDSIRKWKMNAEHRIAQEKGKTQWYRNYKTRICLVERDYQFSK
jgi:heme-degrading monooxygenase HmoA